MTQSGIRYATKEDVPRIHQLIKDLAEYEKAPLEAKATIQQIEETIFGDNPVPGIYLEDLYVDPAYRGKGYGLAFLKELGKICVERDYERLQWWVLDWNQPSIDFYKSLGAVPMDEWTVYRVSGDALKKLGS